MRSITSRLQALETWAEQNNISQERREELSALFLHAVDSNEFDAESRTIMFQRFCEANQIPFDDVRHVMDAQPQAAAYTAAAE